MKFRIPVSFSIIPVFCAAITPGLIALANMPEIIAWCLDHGAVSFMRAVDVFIVVILLGTGVLLSLGIVVVFRLEEWYLEKKRAAAPRVEAEEGLGKLTKLIDSLGDSINRIRELSRVIDAQTRIIHRIGQSLQNSRHVPPVAIRNMLPGPELYPLARQQPCDNIKPAEFPVVFLPASRENGVFEPARNTGTTNDDDDKPGAIPGPAARPGTAGRQTRIDCRRMSLSEADRIFIYLNQLKLDAEFGPYRGASKGRK
jgi:hypothetical protein